ncbi:UNVERIFIED_CONTAM: hypothetical protein GTU68_049334 [Idotea baltica]|nr:hypothetical protein [Idotea baltica]
MADEELQWARIRKCFPYLEQHSNLTYLDSAASAQKPRAVIDAISDYYSFSHANIHRGVYKLSQTATDKYDHSRIVAAKFVGSKVNEVVFLRGATEGFNLLAHSYLRPILSADDEVIISVAEHHANIVPWQIVCKEKGAKLKALPLTEDHCIDISKLEEMISPRTKLISLTQVSNALGTVTDIKKVVEIAKKFNIPVAIDGAQAVSHFAVDVKELGCDFYIFSGHKLYGPTGIGILYGREELLEQMVPYQAGGDMIECVEIEESTYQAAPQKFEAGTPNIAGAIGLAEAMRFVSEIGFDSIVKHERALQKKAESVLSKTPGISTFGPSGKRVGGISFIADWGHPHDIGTILDTHNVAVRTGHHCAQPLMKALGVGATTRISFGLYNNHAELDTLSEALAHAYKILS